MSQLSVILCQPQTFMNDSGEAVGGAGRFLSGCRRRQLLVAVDDADLPLGANPAAAGGSSGGHHGLESVEQHLGTREFARLRIGHRAARGRRAADYQLRSGPFQRRRAGRSGRSFDGGGRQAECWLDDGIEEAMNQFNGTRKPAEKRKRVKRYEGLFILNTAGKEEGVKEVIDKVSAEITAAGGKVETVQKMDKKEFYAGWPTRSTARAFT